MLGWWTFEQPMHATMICGKATSEIIDVRIECDGKTIKVDYDNRIQEFDVPPVTNFRGKTYGFLQNGQATATIGFDGRIVDFQMYVRNSDEINWTTNQRR